MTAAEPGTPVTVVIADDQPVVREGLRTLLGLMPGLTVLAAASSAEEALEAVAAHDPDVLLSDLRMPGIGGSRASGGCARPGHAPARWR